MQIKFIYFDVANTLLHKPQLWNNIQQVLRTHHYSVDKNLLQQRHKLLSEIIDFPIKTSREFYDDFNHKLLLSLGIPSSSSLLEEIHDACVGLKWETFPDVDILNQLNIPVGILSNWDTSLKSKLASFFDVQFDQKIVSGDYNISKPNPKIFDIACDNLPQYTRKEIAFVGDSIKLDTLPGANAGMTTILLDRDDTYPSYPKRRIKTLSELINITT
ncbi:HAD family hydrolase [Reichenbachiella sp. MSK19-1]|uniref:HAD family hydrolase n=1 Tax=Reichenbachiella sp. MSK19-1 TaxID=1897631 RepID=UPI000E6C9B33|nr:HAD family hydrolase [Reichenbachiella sp. MSK19-1]RJE70854.1 hypothetical protein BGP76_08705 [Reichenbachiella sp. MSK19-1]